MEVSSRQLDSNITKTDDFDDRNDHLQQKQCSGLKNKR